MLINFFYELHDGKVPVTIKELLDLIAALKAKVIYGSIDDFYSLSRTILVKDEKHFDKFDRAFKKYFDGLEVVDDLFETLIPEEWLRKQIEKTLSKEEFEKLKQLGDFEKLMEEFQKRLKEQKKRHQGGNKMIGTGGTSPFGAYGQNPAGFRMAGKSRNGRATKVWEKRQYRNLDDSVELGVRNIKMALRRLRKFTRSGMPDQLDIDDTINSTARNAGFLDIKMVPERRNGVKVLRQRLNSNTWNIFISIILFMKVFGKITTDVGRNEPVFGTSCTPIAPTIALFLSATLLCRPTK